MRVCSCGRARRAHAPGLRIVLLIGVFGPLVNLNHFRLLRVVGKGAFGKVRIVERKDTGLTFALKYIRKDEGECGMPWTRLGTSDISASGTIGKCTEYHS